MVQYRVQGVCPFCKSPILQADELHRCPGCHVPHHKECWQQNGGCTTFACKGKATSHNSDVENEYSFNDLIEEYSSNRLIINIEDLLEDEKFPYSSEDTFESRLPVADDEYGASAFDKIKPYIWAVLIVGFLIFLYYFN